MSYTVGRVAEIAGVTVRTLHHHDEIGLLSPEGRTTSGYRRYSGADLGRLQHVLFYRELGFGLAQIASILAQPDTGAADHLRRQHQLLTERLERMQADQGRGRGRMPTPTAMRPPCELGVPTGRAVPRDRPTRVCMVSV